MPVSFPFLLFAQSADRALRWIRVDLGPPLPDLPAGEAARTRLDAELSARLPPRLARDVLRDE